MSRRRSEEEKQDIINKIETIDLELKLSIYNAAKLDAIKKALIKHEVCTEDELNDDYYEYLDTQIKQTN